MTVDDLAYVDEHSVTVDATPEAVWDAALETFDSPVSWVLARLLGTDPAAGFRVVEADRPHLLVLAGRHRFARYGVVLRIEPSGAGARCRLESRADFPGLHGRLYRLAVIGTGGHVVAVRHLLRRIERAASPGTSAASGTRSIP